LTDTRCGPTLIGILIGVLFGSSSPSRYASRPDGVVRRISVASATVDAVPSGSSTTRSVCVSAAESSSDVSHDL
jgi:hypothetical protein